MKKNIKQIFLCLFVIGLIAGSPIIFNRIKYEVSNSTYEVAIDMKSIVDLEEGDLNRFYKDMKKQKISTVVFNNVNLEYLSKYRDIEYMNVTEFEEDYEINSSLTKDANKNHIVVRLGKADFLNNEIDVMKQYFKGCKSIEDNKDIFFYINLPISTYANEYENQLLNPILTTKFFIDNKGIKTVQDKGFVPMIGVTNVEAKGIQDMIVSQIIDLSKEYNIDKVQLRGAEVIGFPKNNDKYLQEFKENDISLVTTEFQTKTGLNPYLENGLGNTIRGHEVRVNETDLTEYELEARIARAVKERNMSVIVLKDFIDYSTHETIDTSVETALDSIDGVKDQLDNIFNIGIAKPIPKMDRYLISEVFIALSVSSMVGLIALSILKDNKLSIMSAAIVFIFALATIILQVNIAIKLYALFSAIVGAVLAIIIPWKSKINSIAVKYIYSSILALCAGIIVSCIMYGTGYMLKLQAFAGVKLLYVLPPILIALWALIDDKDMDIRSIKVSNIIKRLKWYHYIGIVIVILVGYIYINRSGNSGNASEFELYIRTMLEEILYARPRTKEFILGYPMLLIGYYLYKKKFEYSRFVMALGAIATMSTVNSFTHLHTPFLYSLIRSAYGVIFGAIVGIIYIIILNIMKKFTKEA